MNEDRSNAFNHTEDKKITGENESMRTVPVDSHKMFMELVPDTIDGISRMIQDQSTPPATMVALFNIVLERALGKPETPIHVTSDQDRVKAAEKRLMALVMTIQNHREMLALAGMAEESLEKEDESEIFEEKAEED